MKRRDLSFIPDLTEEDKLLLDKTLDRAKAAEEKYVTCFSFFMNEHEAVLCEKALASVRFSTYVLWGGYEGAERRVLCTYPEFSGPEQPDFPIVPVTFSYREEDRPGHRDILGALMSLQIKRECVGDILIGEDHAVVFVRDTVSPEVLSIRKIGRAGVKVTEGITSLPEVKHEFKEINGTVASLRFDCIAALAIRVSREKTAALIKSGAAEIDHVRADQPGKTMEEGSVFSIRGYGKFLFRSVNGRSAKDRLHITVCKFI